MDWSSSAAALTLALLAKGCVTGHLFDAARRIEQPVAYDAAAVDDRRLILRYTAEVMNDDGDPLERRPRQVAVALEDLRRPDVPVERFPVERLSDRAPLTGTPLHLGRNGDETPYLEIEHDNGRDVRLALHQSNHAPAGVLESAALTRRRIAPWVYPLVPFALVVDVVTNPVLLFFAPAVMVVGD